MMGGVLVTGRGGGGGSTYILLLARGGVGDYFSIIAFRQTALSSDF